MQRRPRKQAVAKRQEAEQVRAAEAQAWQQAETALQTAAAEKESLQKIVEDLRTEVSGLHAAAAAEQQPQNKSLWESWSDSGQRKKLKSEKLSQRPPRLGCMGKSADVTSPSGRT